MVRYDLIFSFIGRYRYQYQIRAALDETEFHGLCLTELKEPALQGTLLSLKHEEIFKVVFFF